MSDSILRDLNREQEKMYKDIASLQRHYDQLAGFVRQHVMETTVEWAKLIVDHPKTLLLTVETTQVVNEQGWALGNDIEPIRLTVLQIISGDIWDQYLSPTYSKDVRGEEYHGLTQAKLEGSPRFADVWARSEEWLSGHHLIIFGADHARRALRSVSQTSLLDDAYCLHNKCKEYYGQFYELSLERVLAYQGIEMKREELKDSLDRIAMLAQVVRNLAAGMPKQQQEEEDALQDDDLDAQPFF